MIIDHEFKWCVPKQKNLWDQIILCQTHGVNFVFYLYFIVIILLLQAALF